MRTLIERQTDAMFAVERRHFAVDVPTWIGEAACSDVDDPDLFYPVGRPENERRKAAVAEAQEICADCPVKRECLNDAVDRQEMYGVWGGIDFESKARPRWTSARVAARFAGREVA